MPDLIDIRLVAAAVFQSVGGFLFTSLPGFGAIQSDVRLYSVGNTHRGGLSMNETTEKAKRPTSITVICVIGFLGALVAVSSIFSPASQQIGSWYAPYLGFSTVVGFVCMVGLWRMKKWAAYAYTGFAAFNQMVLLAMGLWNVFALLIPAVFIFFALRQVPKMS